MLEGVRLPDGCGRDEAWYWGEWGSGIYVREAEEERGSFVWCRSRGEFTNDYGDLHSILPLTILSTFPK
jgi:hypothetical protein